MIARYFINRFSLAIFNRPSNNYQRTSFHKRFFSSSTSGDRLSKVSPSVSKLILSYDEIDDYRSHMTKYRGLADIDFGKLLTYLNASQFDGARIYLRFLIDRQSITQKTLLLAARLLANAHIAGVQTADDENLADRLLRCTVVDQSTTTEHLLAIRQLLTTCIDDRWLLAMPVQPANRIELPLRVLALICAAIRHRRIDICQKIFDEMASAGECVMLSADCRTFDQFIAMCASQLADDSTQAHKSVRWFLRHLQSTGAIVDHTQIAQLIQLLRTITGSHRFQWNVSYVQLLDNQVFRETGDRLTPTKVDQLSESEHRNLLNAVEQIINSEQQCRVSTPAEIKRFYRFINESVVEKSIGLVIDGLNYFSENERHDARLAALNDIVQRQFNGKPAVIFGREHLFRTNSYFTRNVQKIASIFTCSRLADDDLLLIYAALRAGANCCVLSNDEFGVYRRWVDECADSVGLFARWIRTRKYSFNVYNGKIFTPRDCQPSTTTINGENDDHQRWYVPFTLAPAKIPRKSDIGWIHIRPN